MKIALTHMRHASTGGTERFLNQIAAELLRRGHEVTIICRTCEPELQPDASFVCLRGWALGRGHRLWRFARGVERHIKTNSYDLVFGLGRTWSQDVIRVGGGLYSDQIGKGLGRQRYWPRDLIAQAIEQRTFAAGNYRMVIANSRLTESSLIERYEIPPDRIVTIHNGVDTNRFNDSYRTTSGQTLRNECGFSEKHLVYLFLGSGYRRKGLDRLLEAFPSVVSQRPESRLIVAGNDSGQQDYEQHANLLGIGDKVVFLGKRDDPEVCYNAADIYVMPTRFDAFGYSAIEALACGLPVVITETSGAAEVMQADVSRIVSGKEAMIPTALCSAMLDIAGDAKSDSVRNAAKALARQYSVERVMTLVADLLESQAQA